MEKAVWDKVAESFSQPEALLEMLTARNAAAAAEAEAMKVDLRGAQDQLAKRDLELRRYCHGRDRTCCPQMN